MTTQLTSAPTTTRVTRAGILCIGGALVGVGGGLALAVIDPVVGLDRFSYPTGPVEFILFQLAFALNHVLMLLGVLAVGWSGGFGVRRPGAVGLWISVVSLGALTLVELIGATQAYEASPSSLSPIFDVAYPVLTLLILVGLLMLGVSVLRERRWTSWRRWAPLSTGLTLGLLALPGLALGFFWARIGLTLWVASFIVLGLALMVEGAGGKRR